MATFPQWYDERMRRRFRILDEQFAAETFVRSGQFEVKVFCLKPLQSYFKSERTRPLLSLRGPDEQQLLDDAIRHMRLTRQKNTAPQ